MRTDRWRRAAAVVGIAGISAALLTGCGGSGKDAVKRIKKAGVVNIAVYREPDAETTIGKRESELMETIASGLGVSPEYVKAESIEEVQNLLLDGTADFAIGGIPDATEISDKLERSDPYADSDLYVVTRRGDYSDSPAAFSGRTLAFTEELPEAAFSWAGDVKDLTPVYIDETSVGAGLSQKKIDGYVCTVAEAKALSDLNGQIQYQNLIGVQSPGYVILTKKSDGSLLSGINTIIGMDAESQSSEEPESADTSKGE